MKGDYSWWCKDCMKIIKNEWHNSHKKYHSDYMKKWYQENKEIHLNRNRKWHIKNIEYHRFLNKKYYAEDPERRKRSKRNWLNKRPEYLAIQKAIRRSREYKSQGSFSEEEWKQLKQKYNYRCLSCNRAEPEIKLTPDHVIPLILGGSSYINNIQPLCKSCNSYKYISIIDFRKNIMSNI